MLDTFAIATKIAGVLLLSNTEITLKDIEAIPFVSSREEAYAIAQKLVRLFGPPFRIEVDAVVRESEFKLRLASVGVPASPATG